MKNKNITPIADLCHFGVPDWLENFQNPDFPAYFAEYGWWNECLSNDEAFVTALKNLCKANELAEKVILKVQPDVTFIQSETTEYNHAEEPSCHEEAHFLNERRFVVLDLTYGYPVSADMYQYLLDNGMTREEYEWFGKNHVKAGSVMGSDYYVLNEHLVHSDGTTSSSGEIYGYYVITKQYYELYQLPVMHTETNIMDAEKLPFWLCKEWANLHHLKLEGVPILGFTWYSLTDQVDWDSTLREDNGNINPLGLCDLDRKLRPVGYAYKKLIERWRDVLPTESFSLTLTY